jgi:hypothetical protein
MNLRWSDGLSLIFRSMMMLQEFNEPVFYMAIDSSTPRWGGEGDYIPRSHWSLSHELDEAGSVFF